MEDGDGDAGDAARPPDGRAMDTPVVHTPVLHAPVQLNVPLQVPLPPPRSSAAPEAPLWLADTESEEEERQSDTGAADNESDDESDDDGVLGGVDVLAAWAAQARVQKGKATPFVQPVKAAAAAPVAARCADDRPTTTPASPAKPPAPDVHKAGPAHPTPVAQPPTDVSSGLPTVDPLPFPLAGTHARGKAPQAPRFWCAACGVTCTSLADWQQHHLVRSRT